MMSKAYAGRLRPDARGAGRIDESASAPVRWGFTADASDPARRSVAGAAIPPEPGDRPIDGDSDLPQLTEAMREADAQPLPGALPTMRFWMVVLAGMAMVALTALMMF